jgi:hypothetical protein
MPCTISPAHQEVRRTHPVLEHSEDVFDRASAKSRLSNRPSAFAFEVSGFGTMPASAYPLICGALK